VSKLILASASATRAQMLKKSGVIFDVEVPLVDEDNWKTSLIAEGVSPSGIADALADTKARSVSQTHADAYVIGADQVLVQDGQLLSKATDRHEAQQTLKALSDSKHTLLSAVVVYQNGEPVWRTLGKATLTARPLSDVFIEAYLDALGDDAFWSVGCYQIEGLGAQLFTDVDGDQFTVLGLPLLPLLDFLRRIGCMPL